MRRKLRMRCSECGYWNRVSVNKIFFETNTGEPQVKVFIPFFVTSNGS